MGFLLRAYMGTPKYDRNVGIDPSVWSTIAGFLEKDKPSPFSNAWLAAEVFQYEIPAEALPLGKDASDEILLNQCGISLVLFVLNKKGVHWTLLVYPVREDHKKRKLYHYDSYGGPDVGLAHIHKRTMLPHVRLIKGGLFHETIFDFDNAGSYKYFTNPTWTPEITGCRQTDWWSCGYISLGVLDILCRKTEADPATMSNPTIANMDPLQRNDIPIYKGSLREGEDLQNHVVAMLTKVKSWVELAAKPTVWKIQESGGRYANPEGSMKKKIDPTTTVIPINAVAVFKTNNTSWQPFSWDDYD